MLVSYFWDQHIVEIMLRALNEDNLGKWDNGFCDAHKAALKLTQSGKSHFPSDTVRRFLFNRLVSSSVGFLEELVTEVFSTSVPSFSSLVWWLLHSLIWYGIPFHHHFICSSADCFPDTLPSSNASCDCYPIFC